MALRLSQPWGTLLPPAGAAAINHSLSWAHRIVAMPHLPAGRAGKLDLARPRAWSNSAATQVLSQYGLAAAFNGSSQYLSTTAEVPNPDTAGMTLLVLLKPTSSTPGSDGTVVGFGSAADTLSLFRLYQVASTGHAAVQFRDSGGTIGTVTSTQQLTSTRWHPVACWSSGSNQHGVRINRTSYSDTNNVAGAFTAPATMAIGCLARDTAAIFFGGQVAQVIAVTGILSAAEIDEWASDPTIAYAPQHIWVPLSGNVNTLTITAGSYTQTGNSVILGAARALSVTAGAYALSGQAVGLAAGRRLAVSPGSYLLTGSDVVLTKSGAAALQVTSGSYTLNGQPVGLAAARRLSITAGSYTQAGNSVILGAARALGITAGAYALSGQAVGLAAGRRLAVTPGSYLLTGSDVVLTKSGATALQVTPGVYTLTAQDVLLRASLRLAIASGLYALTGRNVTLLYASPTTVRASISPYRRSHVPRAAGRPAQLSTGRRRL